MLVARGSNDELGRVPDLDPAYRIRGYGKPRERSLEIGARGMRASGGAVFRLGDVHEHESHAEGTADGDGGADCAGGLGLGIHSAYESVVHVPNLSLYPDFFDEGKPPSRQGVSRCQSPDTAMSPPDAAAYARPR